MHQVDLTTIPSHSFYAPKNVLVQAFRQSAVDMTLLSMADIHIISADTARRQRSSQAVDTYLAFQGALFALWRTRRTSPAPRDSGLAFREAFVCEFVCLFPCLFVCLFICMCMIVIVVVVEYFVHNLFEFFENIYICFFLIRFCFLLVKLIVRKSLIQRR